MYIYYVYSQKASFYSNSRVPFITLSYELTGCSNHTEKLKLPVPEETPTITGTHHSWDWIVYVDATSYSTGQTTIYPNHPREGNFV